MALQAFNNDKKLKTGLLKEVKKHYEQDQIVKGSYGQMNGQWSGCAVGCSIRSYNLLTGSDFSTSIHKTFEKFGIPEWLARVDDTIFEGLPEERAKKWPGEFLKAIRPGSKLDNVKAPFVIFILEQNLTYFDQKDFPDVVKAIHQCIKLYKAKKWDAKAARAAEAEAWSAAEAARAAESAASAESAAYVKYAGKLIELLKECK